MDPILNGATAPPTGAASGVIAAAARAPRVGSSWAPRFYLLAGSAASIAAACHFGSPAGYLEADPALARLLRGMALVKAAAVVAGLAAVYWRLGWPIQRWRSSTYLVTAWILTGSTMLIWQLSWIPAAAVLFHTALIGLLMTAWRDDLKGRPGRTFPRKRP